MYRNGDQAARGEDGNRHGATEGIGAAIARLFVAEDASVVLVARRQGPGRAMVTELGDRAVFVAGDATRAPPPLLSPPPRLLGGPDVLVNNAGLDLSGIESSTRASTPPARFST